MTWGLGIDVGDARTRWASIRSGPRGEVTTGSFPAVGGAHADGSLVVGDAVAATPPGALVQSVTGFIARLGESEPMILAGTPYGVEALVGRLIDDSLEQARMAQSDGPLAVVLVHDDGLDQFRAGLLVEAARLAGISPSDIVLAPRGQVVALDPDPAVGAAMMAHRKLSAALSTPRTVRDRLITMCWCTSGRSGDDAHRRRRRGDANCVLAEMLGEGGHARRTARASRRPRPR